jgi:DNA invertase Pin-like site-specific DNA recombinase
MARTITQIPVSKLPEYKPKRVCGYGRVSSAKDAMHHSLAAQVSYFSTLIQKTPGWVYAGVYSDEAFTGTKNERPQFQQMLSDCRAGQIDMIITKSHITIRPQHGHAASDGS